MNTIKGMGTHEDARMEATRTGTQRRRTDRYAVKWVTLDSIKRLYPTDDGVLLEGTPKWRALAVELARVRAEEKDAKTRKEGVEQAIREMLGAASGVKGDGWELTCRANRESNRINWPAVAQGWRQLITAPEEEIEAVLSIHTETVQGPRVLRTSFKGATDD